MNTDKKDWDIINQGFYPKTSVHLSSSVAVFLPYKTVSKDEI